MTPEAVLSEPFCGPVTTDGVNVSPSGSEQRLFGITTEVPLSVCRVELLQTGALFSGSSSPTVIVIVATFESSPCSSVAW